MPRDKTANHIKIMAAAKAEFMEFGFEKSSMRSIADRCGMTAALRHDGSRHLPALHGQGRPLCSDGLSCGGEDQRMD